MSLCSGEQIAQVIVDRRHAPAGLAVEGIADVVRAFDGIAFADKADGENELVPLVEGVEHLVARDADGSGTLDAAFYLDMARLRHLAIDGGRV